jgi:hypothetical protein
MLSIKIGAKSMGYRSDVYLRVNDSSEKVLGIARKMDKELDKIISEGTLNSFQSTGVPTDMCWESIKWYANYPDIAAVMNILSQLPDEDYGLVRIGEETDDIEYLGDPAAYDMYVSRRIEW